MYIEDGNADLIEGGLINFEKRRLKAEIIKDLQNYQAAPYCLTVRAPSKRQFMIRC